MQVLLLLAAVGLCWAQYNPNTQAGRTSIVHLFEWRWADIAQECERYLAPNGFGGVQVSPPNENIVITNPNRPWWERYQPISYKICSRSGNENEFRDMVTRCNNVGVRIYVDAVVNHMCGSMGGSGTHSTCGSYFNTGNRDFPAVPYSAWDFNDGKCHTASGDIENYGDMYQVRDCKLTSLLDLALEKDYVRTKVAEYMNHLIDIGVAGFRIDAAKHMWPGDIKAFLDKLHNLNTQWFSAGTKPFIYQEKMEPSSSLPAQDQEHHHKAAITAQEPLQHPAFSRAQLQHCSSQARMVTFLLGHWLHQDLREETNNGVLDPWTSPKQTVDSTPKQSTPKQETAPGPQTPAQKGCWSPPPARAALPPLLTSHSINSVPSGKHLPDTFRAERKAL